MFQGCDIISVYLGGLDMNYISDKNHMLYNCTSLKIVIGFKPLNVENMSYIFNNYYQLNSIYYYSFTYRKIKKMK